MTLIERLRKVGKDYDFHDNAGSYDLRELVGVEVLQGGQHEDA